MNLNLLGLAILMLVVALALYYVAPRVGPNPWFGFRVGYTLSSREVWEATHRYLGKLMVPFLLPLVAYGLAAEPGEGPIVWGVALLVMVLIPPLIATWFYAVKMAERVGSRAAAGADGLAPMEPLRTHPAWLLLPLVVWLGLAALSAATYDSLPGELATHFAADGEPDDWMSKGGYTLFILGITGAFALLPTLLAYVGRRYPMVLYRGRLNLGRNDLLTFACMMMTGVLVVLAVAHADTLNYGLHEAHLGGGLGFLLVAVTLALLLPVLWLVARWLKVKAERAAAKLEG